MLNQTPRPIPLPVLPGGWTAPPPQPLLQAALSYAALGWRIFPLHCPLPSGCSCGKSACGNVGKHPRYHDHDLAHGHNSATTDPDQITRWWRRWPEANIGLAIDQMVIVDIDPRNGGHLTLDDLEAEHGKFPTTVESLTGGGGRHLFYQDPGGSLHCATDALGPGVDIKTHGGYVVLPPSLHASGQRYEWEVSSHPDLLPFAALPAWMPLEDQTEDDPETGQRRSLDDYTGSRVGDDYNRQVTREEVRALLKAQGARLVHSANGVDYFCRPGKTGHSFSGTLGHLPGNRLRSFSPNWTGFPPKKGGYQPFAIYTYLKHDGNFTAAMKALAAEGYGRNGQSHVSDDDAPLRPPSLLDDTADDTDDIHLTDVGNGLRLVQQFGHDLRYVITWRKWLIWHGGRWVVDEGALVEWRAKQVVAGLYAWAQRELGTLAEHIPEDDDGSQQRGHAIRKVKAILKWAHDSENGTHIDLMVKRARVNPKVQLRHDQLDVDPMLLQCANGTIDLRTGARRDPQRSDYITKQSPVLYDPDAICPRWQAFLQRILGYPQAHESLAPEGRNQRIQRADRMMTYLKRLVGMSLTADITAQQLQFLYGTGQNGKSTFLNTILALLGEYGMQAAPNFLLVREHEQHPTELTDLFGKRFVSTIEIEKGKELAEALMKTLTGSERVRARRMREDFWEFPPTWKVWLAANDKPKVKGRDKATWRRIKLIPFEVTIPDDEVDPDLPQTLLQELPGILNWAIEGCLEWQEQGLQEPEEVTRATEAYREETDILGQFAHECCTKSSDRGVKTQSSVLHKAFDTYAGTMLSAVGFADLMKASGYKKTTIMGKVYWLGIGLKTPEPDAKAQSVDRANEE